MGLDLLSRAAEDGLTAALAAGLSGDATVMRRLLTRLASAPDLAGDVGMLFRRALAARDFADDSDAADVDPGRRPARMDVVLQLHRYGSLTDAELAAALEMRLLADQTRRSYGLRAVDPANPVVDGGGKGWGGLPEGSPLQVDAKMAERMEAWLIFLRSDAVPVKGKRACLSVVDLVWRVVVDNAPCGELDRELGCRKGLSVATLQGALALYGRMMGESS